YAACGMAGTPIGPKPRELPAGGFCRAMPPRQVMAPGHAAPLAPPGAGLAATDALRHSGAATFPGRAIAYGSAAARPAMRQALRIKRMEGRRWALVLGSCGSKGSERALPATS